MKIELPIPKEVVKITTVLENNGFLAYIVGGCVRDLLMNREPKDWDVTTDATPEEIVALFEKTFYENNFGTVTVVNEETDNLKLKNIEITPFRIETTYSDHRHPDEVKFSKRLEDDLSRRDLTINALAYNPSKGQLIDEFGGIKDIKDKVVRTVGNPNNRFTEDALRLLRAIRISTELGFTIEKGTAQAIENNSDLLKKISKERIREEFNKIIMTDSPMIGLQICQNLHLLEHILPEILPSIGTTQNGSHIYDVWEHLLRALQHSADRNFPLHLRLSALWHDIGKPASRRWDNEKKDWTFYGHEVIGAKMVKKIMADLKYSKDLSAKVELLVRYHMFFSDIEQITLSAVRRVISKVGEENIWDLMKLRMCDRIGMGRPKEDPYRLRKYEAMIEEALRSPTSVGMLKIDGQILMTELALKPGPKIGYILHILLEEVLEDVHKNDLDYLLNRAKELLTLDDQVLIDMTKKAKAVKDEVEAGELAKINKKYKV